MTAPTTTRRRREVITRADGSLMKPAKAPRADVLWYPRHRWVTVLVRRTHDYDLALRLAQHRWAEIGEDRPLVASRHGWWRTTTGFEVPDSAALDQLGRVVLWCPDTTAGAGPGVEWRP